MNTNPVALQDFLDASIEVVRQVAPASMVYAPGGTRRSAVLNGIVPWSKTYFEWVKRETMDRFALIFEHGVSHLLSPMLTPGNVKERNQYREQIWKMGEWIVAGDEAMTFYERHGWRVRIIGAESIPEWASAVERLQSSTSHHSGPTLWWTVADRTGSFWDSMLSTALSPPATTRTELIRSLYGEEIPLVTLLLAFGKPQTSPDLVPPILQGDMQCYWSQQVGYSLTQEQLRTIFHDYAFLRTTWQKDKLKRAEFAAADKLAWQNGPIIGIGKRLGPFWYPQGNYLPDTQL